MARRSKIPVEFYQDCVKRGKTAEGMLVVKMKANDGQRIEKGKYDCRMLKRCLNLGWVTRDSKDFYWQLPWAVICGGYESVTHAYIDHKHLNHTDFKAMAVCLATRYLIRIQDVEGGKPSGTARKKPTIKPDNIHEGGMSNTLVGKFFDKTPQWASKMRGICKKAGIMGWERRHKPCPEMVWREGDMPVGHYLTHDGTVAREIASKPEFKMDIWFVVPSELKKRVKRVFNPKDGVYCKICV